MGRCFAVAVTLTVVLLADAQPGQREPKDDSAVRKELEKLQGVWTHVSREVAGTQTAGEDKDSLFVVRGDILVLKRGQEVSQVGRIKIVDAGGQPKKLDLVITDGPNEGLTVLAIYQIEGNQFKYCGNISNRPKEFTTKEGDKDTYCSTYKRAKP